MRPLPAQQLIAPRPRQRSNIGPLPQTALGSFRGPLTTLDNMAQAALGPEGERSMLVRQFTEFVVRDVAPKDYLGEILAIRNCFVQWSPWRPGTPLFKYVNDPRHVEMVKTPERQVIEIMHQGCAVTDCDDSSTMAATMALHIGREVELVAMGFSPNSLSHVAIRVKEPKSSTWIILDGVAGPREREAAGRAREIAIKSID